MAEYYTDWSNPADYNEWHEYNGSNVSLYITGSVHRTYCNAGGSGWGYARSPVRAIADGGDIVFEFQVSGGGEGNSVMYQTSDAYAKVHYYIQIGNAKLGVSVWYNNSLDYIYVNAYNGGTNNPEWGRSNNTALIKITYNSTTGLAEVLVDGAAFFSQTMAAMTDCTFAVQGYAYYRYACTIDVTWFRFTAGELSDILYVGDMNAATSPLEFKSPFDGFIGNRARYDMVYAPELTDLVPEPDSWVQRYTNTDYKFGDGQISTQKVYDSTRYFEIWGHLSGHFYIYMDDDYMYGYDPWTVYVEAINRDTGKIEEWRFEISRTYIDSVTRYWMIIYEPDGTQHSLNQVNTKYVQQQWTCVYWEINEEDETLTWVINNRNSPVYSITVDWVYEWYSFRKITKIHNQCDYMTIGGMGWWFRGVPGKNDDQMDSALQCIAGSEGVMECTGTQWMEKVFNVFRDAIYNPLLLDDPATLKGMKLTNVDGQGAIMALDSVCVIIDMYKRVYVYSLKEDTGVAESIPDIIHAYRSTTGHYWELIDMKTAGDESRIYSEQCAVEVALGVPGVCDYDPAANTSKTMVQLVHEGVVNPLYLRAFKVPGQHQISIVTSEEISAYKVIVNILLAT